MLWNILMMIAGTAIAAKIALDWLKDVQKERAAHDASTIEGGKTDKG